MIQFSRIVLDAPRLLRQELFDVSLPIREDAVLARTLTSAISIGTELAAFQGSQPLRPGPAYPRLLGYCNVAQVEKCGAQVRKIREGDRIFTHQPHGTGFVVCEGDVLIRIPDDVDDESASLIYFAQLFLSALQKLGYKQGQKLVIIGLGPIGLAGVLLARVLGLQCVAVGHREEQVELAAQLGACASFLAGQPNIVSAVAAGLGDGPDIVITTANPWAAWLLALEVCRAGSKIGVLGFPGREETMPEFNPLASRYLYDKQLEIHGCGVPPARGDGKDPLRANLDWILGQIASGDLAMNSILGGRISPHELSGFFDNCSSVGKPVRAAVINWSEAVGMT